MKMITRTFETHHVTFLAVDLTDNSVREITQDLTSVKSDADALKQVKKLYETDELVVIKITGNEVSEEIRGMDEAFFYVNSVPVTRPASQMVKHGKKEQDTAEETSKEEAPKKSSKNA